ncbi:MAG: DUF2357 domain-containing protein [Candidatus Coprovivens sp.]
MNEEHNIDLRINNLFHNSSETKISTFARKTKSDLVVDLHFDKYEANFEWLDVMEGTIRYLDNILRNPNRFIINEDEIVKIEQARRITVDSIKHLSRNTQLIQDIDEEENVKPSKILNINKEESFDTYENRFIYTLINNMEVFVEMKKKKLLDASHLKDDKSLQYKAASMVGSERITIDLAIKTSLHTKDENGNKDGEDLATRIDKLQQNIVDLKATEVFKALARAHVALVRPPIKKTNLILKNTNFQYALKLWDYLQEHFGDEDKREKSDKNYEDDGELRGLFDETFLLNYLAMCTLNKEEYKSKNLKERVMTQVIQKIIDLNASLTEEEVKDMVGEQYSIVKYKNNATVEGITKIYRKHIEKYMNKVSNLKLN